LNRRSGNMARVVVPLADGFEEIEAISIIDILRRAGIETVIAGLHEGPITSARGVKVLPDTTIDYTILYEINFSLANFRDSFVYKNTLVRFAIRIR